MCEVITVSSEEFDRNTRDAVKATERGPVFITRQGRPVHVLLTVEEYRRLAGAGTPVSHLLSDDAAAEIELPLPTLRDVLIPADLS